jgi:hypothetical protein
MKPVAQIFRPRTQALLALLLGLQLSLPVAAVSLDDLLNAAKLGDAAAVTQLVSQGMDTNSTDQNGNSLLILAAREDQPAWWKRSSSSGASSLMPATQPATAR